MITNQKLNQSGDENEPEESTVEYLAGGTISSNGVVLLPKNYRERVGIDGSAPVSFIRLGNALLMIPEMRRFEYLCQEIEQALSGAGITEDFLRLAFDELNKQ